MTTITNLTVITSLALLLLSGCGGDPFALSKSMEKSSTVVLKASARHPSVGNSIEIPVPGGSLAISSALLNIGEFEIEGNSEVEHEDENEDNDDKEDDEGESDEIEVKGPFAIDISSGEAFIDSVAVFPGTFKKVELEFALNTSSPFDGNSIVMQGDFTPTNGVAVPFTLKSGFKREIEGGLAGDGITVPENATVPVVVTFDLAGFFENVDFGNAAVVNGEIVIDGTNNSTLLAAFEANLSKYVEVEVDDDEDEDED